MITKKLEGRTLAKTMKASLKCRIANYRELIGEPPRLTILCAQYDWASNIYVKKKQEVGEELGIDVTVRHMDPRDKPSHWLSNELSCINVFRADTIVVPDALIIQLPVDGVAHLQKFFRDIPPKMDVDCLHPENLGRLFQGAPRFTSCTPAGIMHLLTHYDIPVNGKRVLIINDSLIVGRPLASLMIDQGATVTVAHDRSPPHVIENIGSQSDIVVVAVGIPDFLCNYHLKEGATVIDVGINRRDGKLVGDCHESVAEVAGAITPVPGGVGPLTVVSLMENVLKAATMRHDLCGAGVI